MAMSERAEPNNPILYIYWVISP